MKQPLAFAVAFLISSLACAAPPSADSVDRLFALTRTEKMIDSMFQSMDVLRKSTMAQALQGQAVSPEARRSADAAAEKSFLVMRDELSWEKLKPLYIQIYSDTFTQEEIDGLLAFYASPAGQAYLEKMPIVMQKSFAMTQTILAPMMQRMQEATKQAIAEAKAKK